MFKVMYQEMGAAAMGKELAGQKQQIRDKLLQDAKKDKEQEHLIQKA